jgi:hypothetical protein
VGETLKAERLLRDMTYATTFRNFLGRAKAADRGFGHPIHVARGATRAVPVHGACLYPDPLPPTHRLAFVVLGPRLAPQRDGTVACADSLRAAQVPAAFTAAVADAERGE